MLRKQTNLKQGITAIFFTLGTLYCANNFAQPNTSIDLDADKPEKYKERKLAAEKTGEKKFGAKKRFFNNLYTHYNYYFNANNRLNEVIIRAKSQFTDNYTTLLPFYNYTLEATSQSKMDLDSVIYKATAGILLHDLRSDWVDDMYLILGKAFIYRKDFDSAHQVFNYLNYIYAAKDDGYDLPIGSNESPTNGVFTISTNEKDRSFLKKVFQRPLRRNDALLWMARNYIEQGEINKATGLLELLKSDPIFPKRLKTDLYELVAYNYYNQKLYDSSAVYLEKSLNNAENKDEKGRWEFLAGQLYQKAKNITKANEMFAQAIKHSNNQLLEVYARLNMAGVGANSVTLNDTLRNSNLAELYKLAKKERFITFRDVIYYTAGTINYAAKDYTAAANDFLKSTKTSIDNPNQKNKSFYALANTHFTIREYNLSKQYFDSTTNAGLDSTELVLMNLRKPTLTDIVNNYKSIQLQDSLQAVAKLPKKDITALIKKLYKQYKKEKGEKDDALNIDFGSDNVATTNSTSVFTANTNGEFYFNNIQLKTQGAKDFKMRWGNRPNVDHWNRSAAIANLIGNDKSTTTKTEKGTERRKEQKPVDGKLDAGGNINSNFGMMGNPDLEQPMAETKGNSEPKPAVEITPESMYNNIPFTEEQRLASDSIIIEALNSNGDLFARKFEDYKSSTQAYEELNKRFPKNKYEESSLFYLTFNQQQLGNSSKASNYQTQLQNSYPKGKFANLIDSSKKESIAQLAEKKYTGIYNQFIEGNFEQAVAQKRVADSIYGNQYFTPQLQYIEAIYYIKQVNDSQAIKNLESIITQFPTNPLAEKATTMIDVLKRRKEIETYLTNLEVEKKEDTLMKLVDLNDVTVNVNARDTTKGEIIKSVITKKDIKVPDKALDKTIATFTEKGFDFNASLQHYAVVILYKVDNIFIKETTTAFGRYNKQKFYSNTINQGVVSLQGDVSLLLQGPFENAAAAMNYVDVTKPQSSKILPWLTSDKYGYSIISNENLELLKTNNNIEGYKAFLKIIFPEKF